MLALKYETPPEKDTRKFVVPKTADTLIEPDEDEKPQGPLMQEEFELTSFSRGIFENMPPTKYQDEDLDIPTYQRRNVSIDRGKTGSRS